MIRFFGFVASILSIVAVFALAGIAGLVHVYGAGLPGHDDLVDYQPKLLTRVYSGEGEVVAEFATQRRIYTPIDEVPDLIKNAFISAEDKNFYNHPGVDAVGIGKAMARFAMARAQGQSTRIAGASTITQQVMKNFLVGDERSIERKIKEAILAVRIDGALSKDHILGLYLNEIFFGARSYGIVAAAQNYFGKTLEEIEPQEAAYLAALPKEPSNLHPVKDRARATARRNYVLEEMAQNGHLTREDAETAKALPLTTRLEEAEARVITVPLDYFTSEVRRQLTKELGGEALTEGGYTVRATMDPDMQGHAQAALRRGLEAYDRKRGLYHGPVTQLPEIASGQNDWQAALTAAALPDDIREWRPAVVLKTSTAALEVGIEGGETATVDIAAEDWFVAAIVDGEQIRTRDANRIWSRGDVIFVEAQEDGGWGLRQIPAVQGAFMAMDPHTGRVLALQGGFSYDHSVFNRATQARRQPGSSFKPFVYAAALDAGYTPATIVLDAPVVVRARGQDDWRPKNSSGQFYGPTPLRVGLELSRNLMTVRIAQQIGMDRIARYAERFGVYENMPHHLAYALGAGETTLYQMVAAYGMFANGGKRVQPTLVDRIQDRNGHTLFRHDPRLCQGCATGDRKAGQTPLLFDQRGQIMNPVTAYQAVSMMEGVVTRGTATRTVGGLGFPVAGKTGTTNDAKDAWFIGFTPDLVAGCFIGFDDPQPMGRGAYGGVLCGPVFKEFMANAMDGDSVGEFPAPAQSTEIITVKVDRETGERLPDDARGAHVMVEVFRSGTEPELYAEASAIAGDATLFGSFGEDLPFDLDGDIQPYDQDQDAADPDEPAAASGGPGVAAGPQPPKPTGLGLGTGGLY